MFTPTMTPAKALFVGVSCLAGLAAILFAGFLISFYSTMTSTLMEKVSPDKQHIVKLVRLSGIDVNFDVKVDGSRVYRSPDFRSAQADSRAQVIRDKSSRMVVLEVATKRIFGYHVVEKRALADSELMKVEFTPFSELRYEGKLPKED